MNTTLMGPAAFAVSLAVVQVVLFFLAWSLNKGQGATRTGLFGRGSVFLVNALFFLSSFWRIVDPNSLSMMVQNLSGFLALVLLLLSIWQMVPGSFNKYSVVILLLMLGLAVIMFATDVRQAGRMHVSGIIFGAVFVEIFRIFVRHRIAKGYVLSYSIVAVAGLSVFVMALRSMLVVADPQNADTTWFLFYASMPSCLTVTAIVLVFAEFTRHRDHFSLLENRDQITGLSNWYGAKHAFNAVQNVLKRQNASFGVVVLSMQLKADHMDRLTGNMRDDFRNGMALAVAAHLRLSFRSSDIICEVNDRTWMVILPETEPDMVEMIGKRLLTRMTASELVLGRSFVNPAWYGAGAVFDAEFSLDEAFAACRFMVDRRKGEGNPGFGYFPVGKPGFSPGN